MKKLFLLAIVSTVLLVPVFSSAQTSNDFEIVPKATDQDEVNRAVNAVGAKGGSVRKTYNQQTEKLTSVGDQLASGIMTRDTLLEYVVYLVRFLSQIGIVIGVVMIIYAGYLYASSIFNAGNMGKGNSAIINAIVGVLVIAFSYAIMKLLTSAFLS